MGKKKFDPEGDDYDIDSAKAAGMGPDGTGEDKDHWGSVRHASPEEIANLKLPPEAYLLLKGRGHPTWDKAVKGEQERGFVVQKFGDRYFSVPAAWVMYPTMR